MPLRDSGHSSGCDRVEQGDAAAQPISDRHSIGYPGGRGPDLGTRKIDLTTLQHDPIKILIADDHAIVAEGLRLYLRDPDLEVIGTSVDGQQALEMAVETQPDVLLLDLRMPKMDGFQALIAIKQACPNTQVIILTGYATNENLTEALRLGAAGFLSKSSDPGQIPNAIRLVAAGDAIVDRELLQRAWQSLDDAGEPQPRQAGPTFEEPEPAMPELTQQETRVLSLIVAGLENKRIADKLCVSPNTLKTHMRNIYSKLGVSDKTQAAIWAMRQGLVN